MKRYSLPASLPGGKWGVSALTRRRFMSILAATAAAAGAGTAKAAPVAHWQGRAMGAPATMQLLGFDPARAREVFRAVELEIARLERIFSLYEPQSQIVRLNRAGVLRAPAPELLEVLSLCDGLHRASGGAFDPTVQPLWQALAEAATKDIRLSQKDRAARVAECGWDRLHVDASEIRFMRRGALTLNGVAQGYVTDRIADLLRARGLSDVLIDMGEIAAIGHAPWQVGIGLPDNTIVERITLSDRALATSAPMGTILVPSEGLGHILDPRDAVSPRRRLVSVSAKRAAEADGLSTALCLLPDDGIALCLAKYPEAEIEKLI